LSVNLTGVLQTKMCTCQLYKMSSLSQEKISLLSTLTDKQANHDKARIQ
jgi:hypothetical protein